MIAIAEYIASRYSGKIVEIGIGNYTEVAEFLVKKGLKVVATDVKERWVPEGVEFFVDDVLKPKLEIYEGASLIYSLRPPEELFNPIIRLAELMKADCIIKPLYGEYPKGKLVNYKGLSFYVFEFRGKYEND